MHEFVFQNNSMFTHFEIEQLADSTSSARKSFSWKGWSKRHRYGSPQYCASDAAVGLRRHEVVAPSFASSPRQSGFAQSYLLASMSCRPVSFDAMERNLRVLVSGFKVFDNNESNTSEQALLAIDKRIEVCRDESVIVGDVAVKLLNVYWSNNPSATDKLGAADEIEAAIEEHSPDVVIGLGMGGSDDFEIEQVARDADKRLWDERERPAKYRPKRNRREFKDEPFRRETTLPSDKIVAALTAEGVSASSSNDAGKFLCEDVFYRIMRVAALGLHGAHILRAGFVHLPYFRNGGVSQEQINKGVTITIATTLLDIHPNEYD